MHDVDMTKIDNTLETAFIHETGAVLSLSDVIRLRRFMGGIKEELRALKREHLKVLNESIPVDYVRGTLKGIEFLTLDLENLRKNLRELEFSGKGGKCPVCYGSLKHKQSCWLGHAVLH